MRESTKAVNLLMLLIMGTFFVVVGIANNSWWLWLAGSLFFGTGVVGILFTLWVELITKSKRRKVR